MSASTCAIESAYIEIHPDRVESSQFPFEISGCNPAQEHFAILHIQMAKPTFHRSVPIFILFSIDKTASMEIMSCETTFSKMEYVKHTFCNILQFLVEQTAPIILRVHAFHTEVEIVLDTLRLTRENIAEIIARIYAIAPNGLTDMGAALSAANTELVKYRHANPTHKIVHLFMTDGNPNQGSLTPLSLSQHVDESFTNLFFGFGEDHNAYLLQLFSQKKNAEYHFVDKMENIGLVMGETLHSILFPAIDSAHIRIHHGRLYNWRTNEWTDSLYESVFVGESAKQYSVLTAEPNQVFVEIYGIDRTDGYLVDYLHPSYLLETVYPLPVLCDFSILTTSQDETRNILLKYAFRQHVQATMYHVIQANEYTDEEPVLYSSFSQSHIQKCKTVLKKLFVTLNHVPNAKDDSFMRMLMDDVYVTYIHLEKRNAYMFAVSRQMSQGCQRSYMGGGFATDMDSLSSSSSTSSPPRSPRPLRPPTLMRQITQYIRGETATLFSLLQGGETAAASLDQDLDAYIPLEKPMSCYTTASCLETMQAIHGRSS